MKPETSDTPDDTPRDLEQVEPNRADGRRRELRARKHRASEVREQEQREAMELQSEGVRAKAMAAETIGVDVELEFLNPILRRAAIGAAGAAVLGLGYATLVERNAFALREVTLPVLAPDASTLRVLPKTPPPWPNPRAPASSKAPAPPAMPTARHSQAWR